jgi:heme/copper-type cytochrome/quinol oxidase subunit 2
MEIRGATGLRVSSGGTTPKLTLMKQWREAMKEVDWDGMLLLFVVLAMVILCTFLTVYLVYKWFIGW